MVEKRRFSVVVKSVILMGLFYNAKSTEIDNLLIKIFEEKGIPALHQKGFVQSPFSTSWYGKDGHIGYIYDLCRLKDNSELEAITVYIIKGSRWIQVHLNIFKLSPALTSLEQLAGKDGSQYMVPPNSESKMRLRNDDLKGVPLFDFNFMFRNHKIYSYYTQKGLKRRANQLGERIEKDMLNIDDFVKRWHEMYKINKTNWEGEPIS